MGAEAGKEFGAQNPPTLGFVSERASSRSADTVDVEPYDPRQELGAAELRILYRAEPLAKPRTSAIASTMPVAADRKLCDVRPSICVR